MKEQEKNIMNQMLVGLFNKILTIEERALKGGSHGKLSISEVHVLEAIGSQGNLTMTMIADKLSVTPGSLTVSVNTLVKKGYVLRKKDPIDRRIAHLHLTTLGHEALKEHDMFHKAMIDYALTDLSAEESKIFVKALQKVTDYFSKQLNEQKEKL